MTRFTTDIQMRFRDIDGMGHVNNAVYLSYTELARTQFYMEHARKKTLEDIDFILAHVDIDFESQAVWGDEIHVKRSGRVLARAKSVQVSYDYERRKPKPIPPEFRKLLEGALEA